MKKYYIFCFVIILFQVFFRVALLAQLQGQPRLDSMLVALRSQKDDSNKVKTLGSISRHLYYNVSPLKAFPYANQALDLAEKIKWKKGIADQHNNLGLYTGDTGNNVLARQHYQTSYQMNKELGDKDQQAHILNNIARSYQIEANYTNATDYLFKALTLAEDIKNNELIGLISTNLTGFYITQKNFPKALEYGQKAEQYTMLTKNTPHLIQAQIQIALVKAAMKDTVAAKLYLEKGLTTAEETHDRVDQANVLVNLSALYYPDYEKQAEIMERAKKVTDEINPSSVLALINNANLGDTYINLAIQGSSAEKEAYLTKAGLALLAAKKVAEQTGSTEYLAAIYQMLVHLEEVKGNYKTALEHYKKYSGMNDSLFSQEKKNEIAGIEGKHNIAVKDNEIAINKLMLANQRKTQLGLIAGLALLIIIGGLLFWQSRSRKKTNTTLMVLNNQLDEANKVKARFFSILSHDLRSPIVNLVHFLQLQKDSPDLLSGEQQAVHQQNISESAEDLLNNMEAMLLWSKEQMENFRPNIKSIAVNDLFEYIRKFFGQTEKVNIVFNAASGLMVSTDENYLRTIMQNLTSNAIRALKNTSNASIEWKAVKEGETTLLSITDNGPGIAADQANALFDDSVVNNAKTGLGLHLIRDLAKAIQYKIAVQSELGRGTTFILSSVAV